ncbi:MAG TPA: efflux RND transporter periplasmic adaptor subunit [Chryseosolibacter sp.]
MSDVNTAALVLTLLFLASCNKKHNGAGAPAAAQTTLRDTASVKQVTFSPEQYELAAIGTGKIEMRNLSNLIKLNGVIDVEPHSMATVSAPLGGYITTAGLLEGQAVKKGQVLAMVENPDFITMQQDYLESQARLQFLEKEYERQRTLREEDVNAEKTFQQVASDYKVMQARLNGLEQKLALAGINRSALQAGKISRTANLYAPITGYIRTSNVNIGKYVNPTDVLFEITSNDDLHLALKAFEKDLGKIEPGQTVRFALANESDFSREAQVFLVGKSTGNDRVVPVHCHIARESEKGLLPGLYAKAWIETGTERQYAVPSEAIVQSEGKDYLILQTGHSPTGYTFRFEQVKKGTEQEGYTAVTIPERLRAGDVVIVVKNAYSILSALENSEAPE